MKIIICPSEYEYKILKGFKSYKHNVLVVESGMGKIKMAWCLHELIQMVEFERQNPEFILSGFCGGLSGYKVGDVVSPLTFIQGDYHGLDTSEVINKLGAKPFEAIISQDSFLESNPYAIDYRNYKYLSTDMESYTFAYFCQKSNITYKVVKIISDLVDNKAKEDFALSCNKLSSKLKNTVIKLII